MDPKELEEFIQKAYETVINNPWELFQDKKTYETEPTLSESEWKDLFYLLKTEIPDRSGYSVPYITGIVNYSKSCFFTRLELVKHLEFLETLFGSESHPKVSQFEKKFPSIYHGLCVEFSKIPTILNDDMYEPIVLKWRLKKGL